ncbi:hypothetical protein HY407_02100 [Candidatus Gottesmanbacteria bacterium]|nr:hypothetical protein [Candidatus Gottesmanbacteria bacterium]
MRSESYQHIVISLLLILIAVNLLILDIKVFTTKSVVISESNNIAPSPEPSRMSTLVPTTTNTSLCPSSCVKLIEEANSDKPTPSPLIIQAAKTEREFYIPLGSGSTQKGDWDDLAGSDTLIDTSKYGNIKEVYFIASLRNPTQNGDTLVRLYNVTDKHAVWNTEMKMNGPLTQTLTSPQITLDTGIKLYRAQLKSGLGYPVYLDNGRIRILAE